MPLKVGSKVLLTSKTKEIITKIGPTCQKGTEVIGGFLDEGGQIFKLNYHWELITQNLNRFINKDRPISGVGDIDTKEFVAMKSRLARVAPPKQGYLKASSPNALPDTSKRTEIDKLIPSAFSSQASDLKVALKKIDVSQDPQCSAEAIEVVWGQDSLASEECSWAGLRTGPPGRCKRNTKGSRADGAFVFKEENHTHVEFRNGVKVPSIGTTANKK